MTSKKIIALLLTVCMMLSCISAFAASIELKGDTEFPEDGISVSARRTIWEAINTGKEARNVLIILHSKSSPNFPFRESPNHYDGVTLSFTATCKNEVMADGITTFTVVDAPAGYTRKDSEGDACFGITPADLIAYSPELSALEGSKFGFTMQEGPFDISNLVIKQGTWKPEAVNVGAFTSETLFLSHQGFYQYPSTWCQEERGDFKDYGNIIYRGDKISNDGPYQFFVPEKDGTYNIWVQLFTNSTPKDRSVELNINGKKFNFDPADIEVSKLPSSMAPTWVPEKQNLTVTLKAGDVVSVNVLSVNNYGRPVTIAFVPVEDNDEVSAAILESPTTIQIEPNDAISVAADTVYHPAFDASGVSVTVDGVTVQAFAGTAAKKISAGSGYITGPSARVFAFPVRILPDTNTFPTYATVADAIAQLIYKKQVIDGGADVVVDIRNLKNGVFTDKAVLVNGTIVRDIDWHPIKSGDVITFKDNNTKDAFEPVSVGNLFSVIGGYNAPAGMTDAASKFCLSKNNLKSSVLKNIFAEADLLNTDNNSNVGLKGCHIVGYVSMNSTAASAGISPDSKIYFENVNILGYNVGQGSDRVDLIIDKIAYLTTATEKSNVQDAEGRYYHAPYGLVTRGTHYDNYSNLYIMNSSISDAINVVKTSQTSYLLTTDGMQLVTTVVVTYAEDGSLTTTEILNDRMVMFNKPLSITVAANQKAYVWKSNALAGTTMVPVTDVLLGANFLN